MAVAPSIDPGLSVEKYCGAKRRQGPPGAICRRSAGWGTDHKGIGRCRDHGGSSPSGRKSAERQAALNFARGSLGAEVAIDPVEAMEQAVRLSSGLTEYYRGKLADAALIADEAARTAEFERWRQPYSEAIRMQAGIAKQGVDAGLAERRQRLAESFGAMLVAAGMDGLRAAFEAAGIAISQQAIEAHREAYTARLAQLEAGETVDGEAESL